MGLEELLAGILGGGSGSRDESPKTPKGRRVPLPEAPPQPQERGIGGVMRSVVQIVALREGYLGGMTSAWTGSGTIVHPSGIILTNCHVANPRAMGMSSPPADRLGIAITERSDDAPALSYFAQVVAQDPDLDLAVIRIVADARGRRVGQLNLPAVELGDSDALDLGDPIAIFGYPGIGGETVTFTSGNVSGFSHERGVQASRAWIKTDATIAGGNSGGTAVNREGQLVGIPTQAAAGSGVTPVDARPVLDTNRDGKIDQRDTPMAVGGFINGLRPVNLAFPLLEQAGMRVKIEKPGRVRREDSIFGPADFGDDSGFRRHDHRGDPEFTDLLFCTRITSDGRPINPTTHIPAGVPTVYATFGYHDMDNGTPWSAVWTTGGQEIISQQNTWDDGPDGRKAVKISNSSGVPAGEYHLVLGIGRAIALEGKMVVGNPVDETDSEVSGRVIDADSGRPLADAMAVVLKPGASLREFMHRKSRSLILTSAETDRDGRFTLPDQIQKGRAYSFVAAARGYVPLAIEGALRISAGAAEKSDIGEVPLERD